MAIAFRAQTQIASGGATDPMSAPSLPSGTQDGDMVILGAIVKYGDVTTITDPSGWQALTDSQNVNSGSDNAGNDDGNIRVALWFREKDSGWSTMPALDLSGTPNCTMVGAISYSKGAGEDWVTPVTCTAVDDSQSSSGIAATSGTTLDFASGDFLFAFAGINGDAGTPGVPMTVTATGVTFGAATTRWNGSTSSGTDLRGHSIDRAYSSGTASAGPDGAFTLITGAATGMGVFVFARLRVSAGDASVTAGNVSAQTSLQIAAPTADANITPTTVAATASVPTPAVTAGTDADATPSAVVVVVSNPAPSVVGNANAPPAAIAALAAIDTPTVNADAAVTAGNVSAQASVPTPTVAANIDVTAGNVSLSTTTPTPTVEGNASITAGNVATLTSVDTPTVNANADVTAGDVSATTTVPSPFITAGQNADVTSTTVTAQVFVDSPTVEADANVTSSSGAATTTIPSTTVSGDANVTPTAVTADAAVPSPFIPAGLPPLALYAESTRPEPWTETERPESWDGTDRPDFWQELERPSFWAETVFLREDVEVTLTMVAYGPFTENEVPEALLIRVMKPLKAGGTAPMVLFNQAPPYTVQVSIEDTTQSVSTRAAEIMDPDDLVTDYPDDFVAPEEGWIRVSWAPGDFDVEGTYNVQVSIDNGVVLLKSTDVWQPEVNVGPASAVT